jgi:proton-dependent oligopeptide transporter, POT family
LVSQAATMNLGGVPNDIVNNLNPLALIILIPIFDKFLYPAIARTGFKFTAIKKIMMGFIMATLAMVSATVVQHYIYENSPCGRYASDCDEKPGISVWAQTPAYVLVSFSEIGASITGLEYAFTKAPKNMRSLVTGVFWFSNAFSSALAQALVPLSADPLLVWLYVTLVIVTVVGGVAFWLCFRGLDKEEDRLNALPESTYVGRRSSVVDTEAMALEREKQDKIRAAQGLE